MRSSRMIFLFLFLLASALPTVAHSRDSISVEGGVPSFAALSVGFGDDNFVVVNGFGSIGFLELGSSDIWVTGGLYTGIAIAGEPTRSKGIRGDYSPDNMRVPSEGFGINPGGSLGLTFGFIPQMDIHLLSYVGPSFALLTRYQRNDDGDLLRIEELDSKIGVSYGGLVMAAYTGNISWLRGYSLGIDGGYHNHSFDLWHLGFTLGVAF